MGEAAMGAVEVGSVRPAVAEAPTEGVNAQGVVGQGSNEKGQPLTQTEHLEEVVAQTAVETDLLNTTIQTAPLPPESPDQPIPGTTVGVESKTETDEKAKEADAETAETKIGKLEKVPDEFANDTKFIEMIDRKCQEAREKGEEVNYDKIKLEAVDEYISAEARGIVQKGIPEEITKDKLFKEEMEKAIKEAEAKGETLDPKALQEKIVKIVLIERYKAQEKKKNLLLELAKTLTLITVENTTELVKEASPLKAT